MFEQTLHVQTLPKTNKPMRIAARQVHWLQTAFKQYLEIVGEDIGCTFTLDSAKLSTCFVRWLRAISAQNPRDRAMRREYFGFAAGIMLRELVTDMPVATGGKPEKISSDAAAYFWPEGVACTMFCLAVLYAVEHEEFKITKKDHAGIRDLRFWWSFKENCGNDPNLAVAFFEELIGCEPDWILPGVFRSKAKDS